MLPPQVTTFVALILIFTAAPRAQAVLFLYDGFAAGGSSPTGAQYLTGTAGATSGDSLVRSVAGAADGQKPSTIGFDPTVGWRTTSALSAAVYPRVNSTGLSYPGLPSVAGAADIFRSTTIAGSQVKFAARAVAGGLAAGDTDLYFSALVQFDTSVPGSFRFDEGAAQLTIGVTNAGKITISDQVATLGTSTATFTGGTTYLLAAHVYNTNQIDLWLDPTDFQVESNNDAQKLFAGLTLNTFTAGAALTDFRITSDTGNSIAAPDFIVDEVRGATTWQEALGIPEPTTGMLMLAGIAMLGAHRRARR